MEEKSTEKSTEKPIEKPTEKPTNSVSIKKQKREEKSRRRDPRSWDNIIKLNGNKKEKDEIIERKYNELYNDYKNLEIQNQQNEKQFINLQKERNHLQSELTKSVLAKSRLGDLCRELQKQNKIIKEENLAKIKEAEERRKDVAIKFGVKLNEINSMMDETKETSGKLREENIKMTTKLTELYNNFQEREQDIIKMSCQMEVEREYSQATLSKMELEMKAEREIWSKEHALIQSNLEKSEANCQILKETIKGLQEQIEVYRTQYSDFENTMNKSSKAFDTFKSEMAKMAKQIVILEKESNIWKIKYENSAKIMIELSELKQTQQKAIETNEKKINQLQKLCRQLQADRTTFLKLLKSHDITPPNQDSNLTENDNDTINNSNNEPNPTLPTSTTPMKLTKKEKKLKMLKSEMKTYQDELNKYLSQESSSKSQNHTSEDQDSLNKELSQLDLKNDSKTSTDNQDAKPDSVETELETPNKQE